MSGNEMMGERMNALQVRTPERWAMEGMRWWNLLLQRKVSVAYFFQVGAKSRTGILVYFLNNLFWNIKFQGYRKVPKTVQRSLLYKFTNLTFTSISSIIIVSSLRLSLVFLWEWSTPTALQSGRRSPATRTQGSEQEVGMAVQPSRPRFPFPLPQPIEALFLSVLGPV